MFDYRPYGELGDIPNVIVDGSPTPCTTLTLSHWPKSPTPHRYASDLSTQIAFRFLDDPGGYGPATVVSNNHFDEDGLASVFALVDPQSALARRPLLIDVASAGDFEVWTSRSALRIAQTINSYLEEFDDEAVLYHDMLPRTIELCDHIDHYRDRWARPDARTQAGLDAIERGLVEIVERPDLDLATAVVDEGWASRTAERFDIDPLDALTNDAWYNRTSCLRTLRVVGSRYRLTYRYESWVQLQSRRAVPRVALAPLADELTSLEPVGVTWRADRIEWTTPQLRPADGSSSLGPDRVRPIIERYLATAPSAWSPYAD